MNQLMKVTRRSILPAGAAVLAIAALAPACDRGELARGAQTTNASGLVPRPESTAVSTRTIDNAGFVDNGGRTSDMTLRTEASGMRGTEAGGERPTGTPGSGLPLPIEPRTRVAVGEGAGSATSVRSARGPSPSGAPTTEAIGRIARARCDRETSCNRVGVGRASRTQDACMAAQRGRAQGDVDALACTRGIDNEQLAICLNVLRSRACSEKPAALDALPECGSSAVCAE